MFFLMLIDCLDFHTQTYNMTDQARVGRSLFRPRELCEQAALAVQWYHFVHLSALSAVLI